MTKSNIFLVRFSYYYCKMPSFCYKITGVKTRITNLKWVIYLNVKIKKSNFCTEEYFHGLGVAKIS